MDNYGILAVLNIINLNNVEHAKLEQCKSIINLKKIMNCKRMCDKAGSIIILVG